MWCEQCQSDVATEISADGQQLLCTACQQPVRKVVAPSLHPETRSAREFLERWAREQQSLRGAQEKPAANASAPAEETPSPLQTPTPAAETKPLADLLDTRAPDPEPAEHDHSSRLPDLSAITPPRKKFRIDPQHIAPAGPLPPRQHRPSRPHQLESAAEPTASPQQKLPEPVKPEWVKAVEATPPAQIPPAVTETASAPEPRYRLDQAQALTQGPHFNPTTLAPQRTVFPGRSEAIWGQLMAYAGVGLLTVGTVMVLWGYFGQIEQYASTGWLIATAGQMLLLLGIVTLVGGGMQQTTHEVTQRIEHLGGRIIRIEESTEKILKTPHYRRPRRRSRKPSSGEQEAA